MNSRRRCLAFYPWSLEERTGAHAVLLDYSRSIREAGFALDVFAPGSGRELPREDGLYLGVFERVFGPPRGAEATMRMLEIAGTGLADPVLPAQEGRDEAAMAAAAVLASVGDYDLFAVHYTRCHSLEPMLPPGVPRVLFTYDLDAAVAEQEQLVYGVAHSYTIADEVRRMRAFDLVTVVGPDDLARVRSCAPELNVIEAPYTIPVEQVSGTARTSSGAMLWLSAAAPFHAMSFQWFWQHVWPQVRRERPDARLIVAGRIAEVARALGAGADAAVELAGVVSDTRALMASVDLMLAPYYYGDGIKIKVLEGLAHGLPVVTTSHGLSNTHLQAGRDVLVADDAALFARHVVDLLASPASREALSARGLEYIAGSHDRTVAHAPLRHALAAVAATTPSRRPRTPAAASQGAIVSGLKHLVPWAVDRCAALEATGVAVYGAGSHTQALLPIWAAAGGPMVRQIIVSEMNGADECQGVPVVAADGFDPAGIDAIVLSSQAYERDMATACAKRWPSVPVVPIWRPVPATSSHTSGDRGASTARLPMLATCHPQIPGALRVR